MKKIFHSISLIVLILITGSKTIYSQEKEKSFEMAMGMSRLKIKDNNFSSMIHKGNLFFASIGLTNETSKYLDITYFQFNKGKIHLGTIDATDETTSNVIGGAIDWVHVRNLNSISTDKNIFYLGGVFNISYNHYKRNVPEDDDPYYLGQCSIGSAFHFQHPFVIKNKRANFESQINTTLLSYAVYPSYCSIYPDRMLREDLNDISKMDFVLGGKILTINKFQRVNYLASIACELSTKVYFKLNYNWELINIIRSNNLTKVNHNIFLSLIIK